MIEHRHVAFGLLYLTASITWPAAASAQGPINPGLEKRISFSQEQRAKDVTLRAALDEIAKRSGLRIEVDTAAFQKAGVENAELLKLRLPYAWMARTRPLLEFVSSQVGGAVAVRGNRVIVTTPSEAGTPAPGRPKGVEAFAEKVRTTPFPLIRAKVDGVELTTILEFISDKTDIPIWVDHAAFRRAGLREDIEKKQLALDPFRNKSLAQVLPIILDRVDATFRIVDGAVIVVPRERL
jgi:hypothetical protein